LTTSLTLLQRLRDPADADAWSRFFELYAPLIESYARALGLSPADAEEARDECLEVVSRRMRTFEYDRARGGFQPWLHTLVRGKVVDRLRRLAVRRRDTIELVALPDPGPGPDEAWESAWRREHLRYALAEAGRGERSEAFAVFEMLLVEGLSVSEVCERTGWNPNRVYKAKSRVLQRVRETLERLGMEG